jgi:hypothetical protein
LVLRPQAGAWVAIVGLWIPAGILLAIGLLLAMDGYLTAAAVFGGIGLPLAVIPPAYFFRARVALDDRAIIKVGTLRRVGWCAPEAIAAIAPYTTRWAGSRWSEDRVVLESHGYAFRLADGTPIFKLSSTWWTEEDIWQLGTRLGLEGTLGRISSSGMTRPHSDVTTVVARNEAVTGLPATGTPKLQASTVGIVLIILFALGFVLFWPTITGKPYP